MTGVIQPKRRSRLEHAATCTCATCQRRRRRDDRFARLVCLDCPMKITGTDGTRCPSCARTNADRTYRHKHPEEFVRPPQAKPWGRLTVYQCSYCHEYGHNRAKCEARRADAREAARSLREAA